MQKEIKIFIDPSQPNELFNGVNSLIENEPNIDVYKQKLAIGDITSMGLVIQHPSLKRIIELLRKDKLSNVSKKLYDNFDKRYFIISHKLWLAVHKFGLDEKAVLEQLTSILERYDCKIIFVGDNTSVPQVIISVVKKAIMSKEFPTGISVPLDVEQENIIDMLRRFPSVGYGRAWKLIQDLKIRGYQDFHRINMSNFNKLKKIGKLSSFSKDSFEAMVTHMEAFKH